jgi:hypothetical protein
VPASLTLSLDDYDLDDFVALAAHYGQSSFGYVVTPNVDHVIRYCDDAEFRQLYAHAAYVLLDSRLLARILWLTRGMKPPVCPGSDLTARLIPLIAPREPVVLIGGSAQQAQRLAELYRIQGLRHYNPPMGFIRDPEAVEQTLRFVEAHSPFRFCFLAVGAPQQEMLAYALKQRGLARGLDAVAEPGVVVPAAAGPGSHGKALPGTRTAHFLAAAADTVQTTQADCYSRKRRKIVSGTDLMIAMISRQNQGV